MGPCTRCDRGAVAKGLCVRHYQEARRNQKPGPGERCVEGCKARAVARQRCLNHYQAWRRARRPGEDGARKCLDVGCDASVYAKGLCLPAYLKDLKARRALVVELAA